MAIFSQTLKEIIPMNETFKAQLYDTLHDLADGLKYIFSSIQDSLDIMHEIYLMEDINNEYKQELYVWYDFEAVCDDFYIDSCHF